MDRYIWLFPIIFHDMEEVIGFGDWLKSFDYYKMYFHIELRRSKNSGVWRE